MRALGFDGGLAHAGLAVADIEPGTPPKFLWAGVCETTKGSDCLVAEDHSRRATELAAFLGDVFHRFSPQAIYAENFSPPRDARNASMLAWSWGVLNGIATMHGVPVRGKSPVRLKDALTGNRGAKKDEMIEAVREQYPEVIPFLGAVPSYNREHIADAVAAIHAFYGRDRQ